MTSPDRLLKPFETTPPHASLRERSLAAAKVAMAASPSCPDLWIRLWQSRVARLAWAAAMAALVLAHVILSLPTQPAPSLRESPLLLAGAVPDPELAATVTLPSLRSIPLPQLDVPIARALADPADEAAPRNDRHDA